MVAQQLFEQLTAKKQQLSQRIEAITNDFQKGRSADFAEQTTECENDQVLNVIRDEAKEELKQINHALQRIKDDAFGQCTECGEQIAQARLNALPYTDFCINCAN
ncbi:TraR/DksA family transcriptional regulator [Thalassotalea atypica]|uniref:TraR/DksA family transcriptional regulator n=1 Tax=Thalassotalea atypica TaxID=2054316 RepID=UPI0025731A12|nr:TraR/DksA family transcriptional regulator [Thalassotalea atypica]